MTLERRRDALVAGLPEQITLDAEVSLALTLPNGLAAQWRDADPRALVSTSAPELEPRGGAAPAPARAPLRLLVVAAAQAVATVPLVAGLRRVVPDDGGPDGVRAELEIIAWELRAGSLRGPGDFGSYLEFAWRRADAGADRFEPPPLNEMYLRRAAA